LIVDLRMVRFPPGIQGACACRAQPTNEQKIGALDVPPLTKPDSPVVPAGLRATLFTVKVNEALPVGSEKVKFCVEFE
jgi:hypothetical protein